MNGFGFRAVKQDGRYRAEYRLAHWAGHRAIRSDDGELILFGHPTDATIAAANALVVALNGRSEFWRGGSRDQARENAERYFRQTGTGDGEGKDQGAEAGQAEEIRAA